MEDRPVETADLLAHLEASLNRLLGWISAADAKIATLFAFAVAMLGVIAALSPSPREWSTTYGVATVSAGVLQGLAILFASFAAFPRTSGPRGSLVYFGGIASREFASYLAELWKTTEHSYVEELARQCHRNAEIAEAKFAWVKRGLIALYLSSAPWLISLGLLYNRGVAQ